MVTENDVIRLLPINRAIEVVEQAFIDYATDLIMVENGKRTDDPPTTAVALTLKIPQVS